MGDKDIILNDYYARPEIFADLMNAAIFNGEEVLTKEDLSELDSSVSEIWHDKEAKRTRSVRKYHDVIKKAALGVEYAVLAIENQDEVHYAMPIRGMNYDSMEYIKQIKELKTQNRKKGASVHQTGAEFLSGISGEDRLMPVITVVIYYGKEAYNGCTDLHSMLRLEKENQGLLKYIANYKINLVQAYRVDENSFKTGL
ncbi:MAG: hypothetical protein RR238_09530 [Lachnospiraceae bacterium]